MGDLEVELLAALISGLDLYLPQLTKVIILKQLHREQELEILGK
jgi:hypothetical protein